MNINPSMPFSRPMYVMLKPVGAACNLACKYCYYLEKSELYPSGNRKQMSDTLLETFTRQYIAAQTTPNVLFTWHGGEPLLKPLSFYKRALELQKRYAHGRQIDNVLQTNGTLLTDEWCRFFKENNFLIGISIDGPEDFHDEYRLTRRNYGSFKDVLKGINLLQKHGVEFNIMGVVNDYNGDYPLEFYHFFKSLGCHYIQFAPIVERAYYRSGRLSTPDREWDEVRLTDFSVSPQQWGDFLIAIFNEWVRNDVGDTYVQIFDATLANWMGVAPGLCTMAEICGHAGAMEYNGDLYSCDHFVFPAYKLGNIRDKTITDMMNAPEQIRFGKDKRDTLTQQCRECDFLFACNGDCPKNRFAKSKYDEPGHNYLCSGWYRFFKHVAPYMDYMKAQLMQEQPPANIMQEIRKYPDKFQD